MHNFGHMIFGFLFALDWLAESLSVKFANLACSASSFGGFAFAASIVTSITLVLGCGSWVMATGRRATVLKERLTAALRESEAAVRLRDSLMCSLPDSVVVLSAGNGQLLSYADGSRLLEHCLAGPDAKALAAAIDSLLTRGVAFSLTARTIAICAVAVWGRRVGNSHALFLRHRETADNQAVDPESTLSVAAENNATPVSPIMAESAPFTAPAAAPDAVESGDGVIVIGSDGRLWQHNAAFSAQWLLDEEELRGSPHLEQISALCSARKGRDATWQVVASAIASEIPEQHNEWGVLPCTDGRVMAISASRKSDGSTLIRFHEASEPTLAEAA